MTSKARILLIVALSVLVAACESDGSIGVGTGQEPDPVALDFPIAYTKGPLLDEDMDLLQSSDLRDIERFNVGTDLYVLDRASPSAEERNVTFVETQGLGDVMGVEISADGERILFAMRGPFDENLDDEDQPTWNIWEYDIPTAALRRLIASDITAEGGHDLSPHYLADDRIVFVSTRQRQAKAVLVDEGKPQFEHLTDDRDQPAAVLHVMDLDGQSIRQISFNQSHDYEPTTLDDGRILFSRWDNAGTVSGINLYTVNPDGSGLELLYGAESHATGTDGDVVQFVGARETIDGDVMAVIRPFDHEDLGGDVVVIDVRTYVEDTQAVAASAGMPGPAQVKVTPNDVRTDDLPSPGGRFGSVFPLWDGTDRVLASWSICRLVVDDVVVPCTDDNLANPDATPADPLYGIWMYDPVDQTQLPVVVGEEGVLIGEVVAAQPRPNPQFIADGIGFDVDLADRNLGILNIRSVYDVDGVDTAVPSIAGLADPAIASADERPARFLRVVKAVSIPDDDVVDLDNTAFGPNVNLGMREIVAYAPIEPDGSVRVEVPANVPLAVSVLDADGRRISPRHQNWIQVMPGEEVRCNGCHSPQSGLSHGRRDSFDSVYAGAAGTGIEFPNTLASMSPDFGETMAETRTRLSCAVDCAAREGSPDLVYADVWTDPALVAPSQPLEYRYANLAPELARPTSLACLTAWTAACRIVINYEAHIHPIWGLARVDASSNDVTCTQGGCHAPVDAAAMPAVPAGQLDLTDGLSPDQMDHFNAYRELLFGDNEQELFNGALRDRLVDQGVDANGNPIQVTVPVGASMTSAGARASARFFSRFAAGGTHAGYLTPDELRLVAEWLDLGAQYYNNPFDVPEM